MTTERLSLAVEQGRLCVVSETTDYFQPELHRLYWPTNNGGDWTAEALATAQVHRAAVGVYSCKVEGCGYRFDLVLTNGGRTLPIKADKEPLPAPKVRKGTETRYRNGQWEKYTAKGWKVA